MRSDRASRASETVAKPARARQFQATAEASGRLAWVVSIVGSDISWIPRTGRGSSKRVRIDGNGARWQGRARTPWACRRFLLGVQGFDTVSEAQAWPVFE